MAEAKQIPVAAVVGVGPGLGASLARRFAQEYAVAIIARKAEYLKSLAAESAPRAARSSKSLPILVTERRSRQRSS